MTIRNVGTPWKDEGGQQINAHGGGLLLVDGCYYWHGEHKDSGPPAVHCYSSPNLVNWKDEGIALDLHQPCNANWRDIHTLERPKVVQNPHNQFVMWFHIEDARNHLGSRTYAAAKVGVATSPTPTGPFRIISSGRPVGEMSRDLTIFVDGSIAYLISASEENRTMHIYELSPDFTRVLAGFEYPCDHAARRAAGWHESGFVRIFPGRKMEAPAVVRSTVTDSCYWLVASGCTGWDPNEARSAVAPSIWGPWVEKGNPCEGVVSDVRRTFHSQSTFMLPIPGTMGHYLFMADRWHPDNHIMGAYLWLLAVETHTQLCIHWQDEWDPRNSVSTIAASGLQAPPTCIPRDMWHFAGAVLSCHTVYLRALSSSISLDRGDKKLVDVEPGRQAQARWNDKASWQKLRFAHRPRYQSSGHIDDHSIWTGLPTYIKACTAKAYIDVEGERVQARWNDMSEWQQFVLEALESPDSVSPLRFGDVISIRSVHTDKHMDAEEDQVRCRWKNHGGDFQMFKVVSDHF